MVYFLGIASPVKDKSLARSLSIALVTPTTTSAKVRGKCADRHTTANQDHAHIPIPHQRSRYKCMAGNEQCTTMKRKSEHTRSFILAFDVSLLLFHSRFLAFALAVSLLLAFSLAFAHDRLLSISRSLILYFKWLSALSFSHCLIHLQDPTHRHLRPSFLPPLHLLACPHRSHPHFWNYLESAV